VEYPIVVTFVNQVELRATESPIFYRPFRDGPREKTQPSTEVLGYFQRIPPGSTLSDLMLMMRMG
jgi:hypothetical protein